MAPEDNGKQVHVPMTAERALNEYPAMVMAVPEAEFNSDGSEILADILMATSPAQLNDSQATLPDAEKMVGRPIIVTGVGRMKSELESGLGWYLLVDYVDPSKGESAKFQTSSASVMAKLVKLHLFDAYPAQVTITRAPKATRKGHFPLDLTVVDYAGSK